MCKTENKKIWREVFEYVFEKENAVAFNVLYLVTLNEELKEENNAPVLYEYKDETGETLVSSNVLEVLEMAVIYAYRKPTVRFLFREHSYPDERP